MFTINYQIIQHSMDQLIAMQPMLISELELLGEEPTMFWQGTEKEDVLIGANNENGLFNGFHSHDSFFFDYCYRGAFEVRYHKNGEWLRVGENEIHIGHPYAIHDTRPIPGQELIMVHICIHREAFYRNYLPMLSPSSQLFHFLMDPVETGNEKQFIVQADDFDIARTMIELMVTEFTQHRKNAQAVLRPLVLSFMMHVSRQCESTVSASAASDLAQHLVQYISEHSATITLNELSAQFSYNPNYVSTLLRKQTGKTFTKIVYEQRMEKAIILLKTTQMSVQEIAAEVGYSNSSNFFKAFRTYCSMSPRKFQEQNGVNA